MSGPAISSLIGPDDIRAAARRIARHVRRTPVLEVAAADVGLEGPPVTLKLELTQVTGSFKPRGATNLLLDRPAPAAGVSGGPPTFLAPRVWVSHLCPRVVRRHAEQRWSTHISRPRTVAQPPPVRRPTRQR